MPLYEFKCKHCGHKFEALVSISAKDGVRCEKCGEEVGRVYEGACSFGSTGSGGCSGQCSGCSGCGH